MQPTPNSAKIQKHACLDCLFVAKFPPVWPITIHILTLLYTVLQHTAHLHCLITHKTQIQITLYQGVIRLLICSLVMLLSLVAHQPWYLIIVLHCIHFILFTCTVNFVRSCPVHIRLYKLSYNLTLIKHGLHYMNGLKLGCFGSLFQKKVNNHQTKKLI